LLGLHCTGHTMHKRQKRVPTMLDFCAKMPARPSEPHSTPRRDALTPGCHSIGYTHHTGWRRSVASTTRHTRVVTSGGCQIGLVDHTGCQDHTGCHHLVFDAKIKWCKGANRAVVGGQAEGHVGLLGLDAQLVEQAHQVRVRREVEYLCAWSTRGVCVGERERERERERGGV
jgi:hypothetical protein